MRSSTLGRGLALATALAAALLVGFEIGSARAQSDAPATKQSLVDVCTKALKQSDELRATNGEKGPDDVMRWSLRLVAATKDLGDAAKTREALVAHLDRAKKAEEWTKKARANGNATGLDVLESEFRRTEAQLWVDQAK